MSHRRTLAAAFTAAALIAAAPAQSDTGGASAAPVSSTAGMPAAPATIDVADNPAVASLDLRAQARAQQHKRLMSARTRDLRDLQRTHNRLARTLSPLAGRTVKRVNLLDDRYEHPTDVLTANRSLRKKIRFLRERISYWRTGGGMWIRLQRQLPPATTAWLARLRGCETRGIAFPANYQYQGTYRGAYQYSFSTWARAGGSGDPALASPAEQDVRTARFFPSHRSEWGCAHAV